MLVLSRKKGESIQIGDHVELRILSVQGNRVRIGIEAPSDVSVRRGELVFELEVGSEGQPLSSERLQGVEFACS